MSAIRVTANGPGAGMGAALLPVPAGDARAFQSRGIINGYPGTRRIPAPPPAAVPQDRAGQANMGVMRSSDGPPFFTPSLYWYGRATMSHSPVSILSDNQMPVPAQNPTRLPAVVMPGPIILGQKQVPNPAPAAKYTKRR